METKVIEFVASKNVKAVMEIIKLSIKGMFNFTKFIGILISVTVLIIAMFIFAINGMMMFDATSADFYQKIIECSMPMIHFMGVISLLVSVAILFFLFYLYIKNAMEN